MNFFKKYKTPIVVIVLISIIAVFFINPFAIFGNSIDGVKCTYAGNSVVNCNIPEIKASGVDLSGDLTINLDYILPRDGTAIEDSLKQFGSAPIKSFLQTNTYCSARNQYRYYNLNDNYANVNTLLAEGFLQNGFYAQGGGSTIGCTSVYYIVNYDFISGNKFKNQLVVYEGVYYDSNSANGPSATFKTFGLCDFTKSFNHPTCTFRDINLPNKYAIIKSMKIYLNPNGYAEEDVCSVDQFLEKCDGTILYACSGSKLTNKGEVSGKCGVNIIAPTSSVPPLENPSNPANVPNKTEEDKSIIDEIKDFFTPKDSSIPSTTENSNTEQSSISGEIIIGVVIAIALILGIIFYFKKRKRRR